MKITDIKDVSEGAGSANPYVAMSSSVDFALKQVENLEKLIAGVHAGVPAGRLKDDVASLSMAVKSYIAKAAMNLKLAKATIASHSDTPVPKD